MLRANAWPDASAPIRGEKLTKEFTYSDLKQYPHFDAPLSLNNIKRLVSDPESVARHKFYPLLHFDEEWQPFRSKKPGKPKPKKKSRPIRYAARGDAYLYSYYREILSECYENSLTDEGIADCPIAYRQIQKTPGRYGGKCNIDFAKDAFDEITRQGNCVAIALDIKGYFDNLDHAEIKRIWCELLKVDKLPADHFAIFKNITKYRYVDQKEAYRRLGYFGPITKGKTIVDGYIVAFRDMPKQLCSPKEFRMKIGGGEKSLPSIIKPNPNKYGIPQGAPISDLIANFYLIEFDKMLHSYAVKRGGKYMRYSDDILLVLPGDGATAKEAIDFADGEIVKHGPQLEIKQEKTCVAMFTKSGEILSCRNLSGRMGDNGFEYLGFRFDGQNVLVRNSTISRLFRKVSAAAKLEAYKHANSNAGRPVDELISSFNYSKFSERYSRVRRSKLSDDYRTWTFRTYLIRASRTFGSQGGQILDQASGFNKFLRKKVAAAFVKATK